ncbi:NAD(P)/FAD-dependent oxidoreductase [Blastococcus saxobsidens]|uniref:UDP-galactopyranose mutase n=1 Tax=Blastococcus saxobsidens TaxID=138336 RepID=A0A4Q7YAE8_9ACTN|nr:NAD(P)/FAD-dependent oxidoreductase [Blastococcus saxobsidens]RZU33089.1 UDP-galactopyranose mutase [Blastococcus saxobsidens]
MRIGIIGAGATGLTAAYDLVGDGHDVTVLEGADEIGGLAGSLTVQGTPLERFYHHIFESDRAMIEIIDELGLSPKLTFHSTTTGIFHGGELHDFSTPVDMLKFPPLRLVDRIRFGASSAMLKLIRNGERLGDRRALEWVRRWAGRRAGDVIWEPLLTGKFGSRAPEISMAWLWARVHFRTFKLGYMDGGFHQVYEALLRAVEKRGGTIETGKKLTAVAQPDPAGPVEVRTQDGARYEYDKVLVTVPQPAFAQAAGAGPGDVLQRAEYLGATCFVLECDRSVIPYYWLNINDPSFPFLAVVEHTNMVPPEQYGGRHVIYVGNYVPRDDWRYTTDPAELLERYVPWLRRINPDFDLSWVTDWHFSKAGFAQPVVTPDYRESIPPHETSMPGVVLATMSQVYPQDRGQSYAVAMARRVVQQYFR